MSVYRASISDGGFRTSFKREASEYWMRGERRFVAMCALSLKLFRALGICDVDGEAAMGGAGWNLLAGRSVVAKEEN
jgi:hypothetical protein